jgi:hypothetical protein
LPFIFADFFLTCPDKFMTDTSEESPPDRVGAKGFLLLY